MQCGAGGWGLGVRAHQGWGVRCKQTGGTGHLTVEEETVVSTLGPIETTRLLASFANRACVFLSSVGRRPFPPAWPVQAFYIKVAKRHRSSSPPTGGNGTLYR